MGADARRGRVGGLLAPALWSLVILAACWWPRRSMPTDEHRPRLVPHADKFVHFGLFAALGALAAPPGSRGRRIAGTLAWGAALAALTEVGQGTRFVERDPDALDALADFAGVAAATALGAWRGAIRRDPIPSEGEGRPEGPG